MTSDVVKYDDRSTQNCSYHLSALSVHTTSYHTYYTITVNYLITLYVHTSWIRMQISLIIILMFSFMNIIKEMVLIQITDEKVQMSTLATNIS